MRFAPCKTLVTRFKMFVRVIFTFFFLIAAGVSAFSPRWSVPTARIWQEKVGWKAGANFAPSTAVNELEMFQADTFDLKTIDRELGFAADLGMGVVRVFLHNLLWTQDAEGFLHRLESFLDVAHKHHINVMFVLFDSCWLPNPALGKQPAPIPGVHNSQWVQAPGYDIINDPAQFDKLEAYVRGVVGHFKHDHRVLAWDFWNEPDNSGYSDEQIAPLLVKVANWVRAADPMQPLTTPVWTNPASANYTSFQKTQMDNSDVISFHIYDNAENTQTAINNFLAYDKGRPAICTEYMARTAGSTFQPHLELFRDANVIAINWGLVSGESFLSHYFCNCCSQT